MALMTGPAYVESLKKINPRLFYLGERIVNPTAHPALKPHINAAAMTYDLAYDPRSEDLLTATSHLTGQKCNRFTHIHQNREDLVKKVKMLRMLAQRTGSCFQRCVGFDGINALYIATFEMDQELGTDYHQRLRQYLTFIQENDLMVAGSMTDPKGNRSLRPSQQADPDLYLHVVDRKPGGIVIRGAKAHQTGLANSHEMLIMPTVALEQTEQDYAVACAVPADAPGVTHIFGRQTNDGRKEGEIDQGNARFGIVGGETLTILEDVFVPWERVFMLGEYQYSGALVEHFASYHRQNYGGCKGGVSDVIVGASLALAESNGLGKVSHIREKIIEMVHLTETLYAGSIACAAEGRPTPSGAYFVDPLLANVTKQNVTRFIYEICRLSHDIAGGLLATLPSEKDFTNPEVGPLVTKYFKGVNHIPTEERFRLCRLLENMTGGTALIESMHGAGSPQTQRVMIWRQANLVHKKQLAQRLAGITP